MNGYKVCSFKKNGTKEYLVLDVITDVEKSQAQLQGFKSDGSCLPFPLFFTVKFSEEGLLKEAFLDGTNYVKEVEEWRGTECEESLETLASGPSILGFIRAHCRSEKLASDIDKLKCITKKSS